MTELQTLVSRLSAKGRASLARELAAAGVAMPVTATRSPDQVAVIGMGCRFPGGAASPQAFWELLAGGVDAVTKVPAGRWDTDPAVAPRSGAAEREALSWGGFLDDLAGFDAAFFGISPREAAAMDPQQRILLEVCWEALEDAGIPPRSLTGRRVGVFAGMASQDYLIESLLDPEAADGYAITGNAHSATVGRLSYLLNLRGPAIALDTGCSSSLVAVHLASQSLRSGETDMAVAGGIHLMCSPRSTLAMARSDVLPLDGRCKTFDAAANGAVRAEGCGIIILKRLADAERDRDRILAIIRGTAVNQDGRSNGLTAPSGAAQRRLLAEVRDLAGIDPGRVGLVETHGTGTRLGDPIEVEALSDIYGGGIGRCALGAVKTNLGHLEAAAGVAGLIKAVLCLRHGQIAPNLHFQTLNPNIRLDGTRLFVPTALTPWPVPGPPLAAVSAFGVGGTNVHAVLEQAPAGALRARSRSAGGGQPRHGGPPDPHLITLSAATEAALRADARQLAAWLVGPGAAVLLSDLAYTLGRRRSHLDHRLAIAAGSPGDLLHGLRAAAAGEPGHAVVTGRPVNSDGVVFVFSGYGSQWPSMGRELLTGEPAFASVIDQLDPVARAEAGYSLGELIARGEPEHGFLHPLTLFAVQAGLAAVWRSYGVEPAAVIGHSVGEVAAAVAAGALSVVDGARVVIQRTAVLRHLAGEGLMAVVGLPADEAELRLAGIGGVSVAVCASPRSTVVSGDAASVRALMGTWESEGLFVRPVNGAVGAGHTAEVDPYLTGFAESLSGLAVRPVAPGVRVYSTALADPRAAASFDARYWALNLRSPVRFAQAVSAALADGFGAFVEVSAHPVVTHAVRECIGAAGKAAVAAGSLRRGEPERAALLRELGRLHCAGVPVAARRVWPDGDLADLPVRNWQHRRYWLRPARRGAAGAHPLLGIHLRLPGTPARHLWQAELDLARLPWLADHRYADVAALPGAAYCEMALAAACQAFGLPPARITVHDLGFPLERQLLLNRPVTITTTLEETDHGEAVIEIAASSLGQRIVHASARARRHEQAAPSAPPGPGDARLTALTAQHPHPVDPDTVYARLRASGQFHGPAFAGLREVRVSDVTAAPTVLAKIALPEAAERNRHFELHPVLLDCALQSVTELIPSDAGAHLPTGASSVRCWADPDRAGYAQADLRPAIDGYLTTIRLLDEAGHTIMEAADITLSRVHESRLPISVHDKLYERTWPEVPLPGGATDVAARARGQWLLLGDQGPVVDTLCAALREAGAQLRSVPWRDWPATTGALSSHAAAPDPRGVVFAAAASPVDPEAALAEGEAAVLAAARVAGWLAEHPATRPDRVRYWLVTNGGQPVRDGEVPDLAQAALRGLGRVLVTEQPQLRPALLDTDPESLRAGSLMAELTGDAGDDEVAWRAGHRHVARLAQLVLPDSPPVVPVVRREGGYLVSGGLNGVGLATGEWLAERGAGMVVLNGRSAPGQAALAAVERMRAAGTRVAVVQGDVAEPGVAEAMVSAVTDAGVMLRGVVHSAMVTADGLVSRLDAARLRVPWWPKVVGGWRLSAATVSAPLDWWVGYSSASALLGNPGQAGYAAACAWLDALAWWRRAQGLPGMAVNWGQWSEIGSAKDTRISGISPLRRGEGFAALENLIAAGRTQSGVVHMHPRLLAEMNPPLRRSPYFAAVLPAGDNAPADDDWAGPASLAGLSATELRNAVPAQIRRRVCRLMGLPAAELSTGTPLVHLGLDSVMAINLQQAAMADFGYHLPVASLLRGLSIQEFEQRVLGFLEHGSDSAEDSSLVAERAQRRATARAARRRDRRRPA